MPWANRGRCPAHRSGEGQLESQHPESVFSKFWVAGHPVGSLRFLRVTPGHWCCFSSPECVSMWGRPAPPVLIGSRNPAAISAGGWEMFRTRCLQVPQVELEAALSGELVDSARGTRGPSSDWGFLKFCVSRCWGEGAWAIHGAPGRRPPAGRCFRSPCRLPVHPSSQRLHSQPPHPGGD